MEAGRNNENKSLSQLKKKILISVVLRPQLLIKASVPAGKISRWLTYLKVEKKAVRKFTSSLV